MKQINNIVSKTRVGTPVPSMFSACQLNVDVYNLSTINL